MRLRSILISPVACAIMILCAGADAGADALTKSADYARAHVRILKKFKMPRWYHEGLFYDGKDIWAANGEAGKTWVIDTGTGGVKREITPVSNFTEGITRSDDGRMFVTEWYDKKIYEIDIDGDKMAPVKEKSFEPAHPAGVTAVGDRIFVVTWTRGLGTRYDLVELDRELNEIRKIEIKRIQEPSQMAWDGKSLWVTSWYSRMVYRVDIRSWQITGSFTSPVSMTTGIAWDGKHLWLTGTYGDLYELEVKG